MTINNEHQNEVSHMKRSGTVRTKLRNSFIGVASFSIVSAIVGVGSFEVIEDAQQDVIDNALPAARQISELVRNSAAIVDIANVLSDATDIAAVTAHRVTIEKLNRHLQTDLLLLRTKGSINPFVSQFEVAIGDLFGAIREQLTLADNRNKITDLRNELIDIGLRKAKNIEEMMRPAIIKATTKEFADIDSIRHKILDNVLPSIYLLEQFDELVSVDIRTTQRLTDIRNDAGIILDALAGLAAVKNLASIAKINNQLNSRIRALGRAALNIENQEFRTTIGQHIREIANVVRGPNNVITLQNSYFEVIAKIDGSIMRSVSLKDNVEVLGRQLEDRVEGTIEQSIARAEDAILYARTILLIIAIGAFLTAIVVVWRYVIVDVIQRVDRLALITRRFASGDLDVEVDVTGDDELGDFADAMRQFKSNAIRLHKSNKELEQFAYIASHDLKAPLRGIENLANWVTEDLEGRDLSDETRENLDLIQGRIKRMNTLLDGLLQYSRAGRESHKSEVVNLEELVRDVIDLLAPPAGMRVEIVSLLPNIRAERVVLYQIILNLIQNAIKHHDREDGNIRVWVEDEGADWIFNIADDGPGISTKYFEKIFQMFQTLKSRDDVEGSGMGLALVKKLLENRGAKIEVQSNPERRDTVFKFTCPKYPQEIAA